MRTLPNDRGLSPDHREPSAGDAPQRAAPERRCLLSGEHGARDRLIRLAISPEGEVLADVTARAPGRGAWIGVDRATLPAAMAKGKLKGALARAFKGAPLRWSDDLPQQISDALQRQFLAQLGLAARAGVLLSGADRIDTAARSGQVRLLMHAADAADDGRRTRDQSWRVGEDAEGSGRQGLVLPLDRTILSIALGRDNAVHLAITDAGWADRIAALLGRWQDYEGWARDGAASVGH